MQLTILNRKTLSAIPSASGIEIIHDKIFIMGDDSPFLFKLNNRMEIEEKIQITDILPASGNKIAKAMKPDLEAMVSVELDGKQVLLLFGSGSKSPQRDGLVRVNINSLHEVKKHSLTAFYNHLRKLSGLSPEEMNLEAAAIMDKDLCLFNRGKNKLLHFNLHDFISYIEGKSALPSIEIFSAKLPVINGIEAGFSGATNIPGSDKIIFTASIENTSNWIDDGEILGSFVGVFSVSSLRNLFTPDCIPVKNKENKVEKIKVESVTVRKHISNNCFQLLLVTDNDGSASEIIEAELRL